MGIWIDAVCDDGKHWSRYVSADELKNIFNVPVDDCKNDYDLADTVRNCGLGGSSVRRVSVDGFCDKDESSAF